MEEKGWSEVEEREIMLAPAAQNAVDSLIKLRSLLEIQLVQQENKLKELEVQLMKTRKTCKVKEKVSK